MAADLSEFRTRLKKQGTMLCLPLGKSLGTALKRYGLAPGQEVVVRFRPERLEIRPRNTPEEVRQKLKGAVQELRSLRERIQGWTLELPAVSDEALESGETLEGELLGMLECLLADDLEPAIRKLESADELGPASSKKHGPRGSSGISDR
jgi:hypothetical protein